MPLRLLAEDDSVCATQVIVDHQVGDYRDLEALFRVTQDCAVVTFDHEHVPTHMLETLVAEGVNVAPPPAALVHAQDKLVMVIFGANWCPDCLALNAALQSDVVSAYAQRNFEVVKVDVGQFDRNQDFAEQLGVTSRRGIPVAVFLDRDGQLIGVTNDGELEPARAYTSRQILAFIQEVAANRQIVRP